MTDDREDRTTAVGLYHYGHSYHEAARALSQAKFRATHPDAPLTYLYFHAIELFLKAYLRANGHTVADLERRFGHNIERMRKRACELGFDFQDEDLEVLSYMEQTPIVMNSRYISTGYFQRPANEALERTATSLRFTTHESVSRISGIRLLT